MCLLTIEVPIPPTGQYYTLGMWWTPGIYVTWLIGNEGSMGHTRFLVGSKIHKGCPGPQTSPYLRSGIPRLFASVMISRSSLSSSTVSGQSLIILLYPPNSRRTLPTTRPGAKARPYRPDASPPVIPRRRLNRPPLAGPKRTCRVGAALVGHIREKYSIKPQKKESQTYSQ
jgi:hypothetical protein